MRRVREKILVGKVVEKTFHQASKLINCRVAGSVSFNKIRSLHNEVIRMARCEKCGSKVFLVDETITHLEVGGEIIKQVGGGDLHNRNCVKCTYPEEHDEYKHLDET